MDLPQLRTLIQVAELGSLSKAAERLHIAQPALSRQVRLLEEELGARLFDRHGRGMVLTDAGREVLERATRILGEIDDIRSCVGDPNASLIGRVTIGLPPTVSEVLSLPLIAAIRKQHPSLQPRLVDAFSGYLIDWMQRGEIDVGVLYEPQTTTFLRARPLLLESLFLVGPAAAPLSVERSVPFARLAREPLLLPGPRHGLRAVVDRFAVQAGVALKVTTEVDSLRVMIGLVRQGFGKTVLPLAAVHEDVAAGRLTAAPLSEPVPTRRLALALPRNRQVSRAARFTADAIGGVVKDLVASGAWGAELIQVEQ